MSGKKRPYRTPKLIRAGSFEELTRAANKWDQHLLIFGMNGGDANLSAVS